jgi:predicted ATPase
VSCAIHAGLTLWMLGYPDRAAEHVRQAHALAQSLGHPFSVSYACHFAAGFHQWRREREAVRALEAEALVHDTEHGFALFLTAGAIYRGWLLCEDGRSEEGLAQIREGIAGHRAVGAEVVVPAFLALMAEVHETLGRPADGLAAVAEALAAAERSGQYYWEAELYRLKGALALRDEARGAAAAEDAEACFLRALEIARRQRAKSMELRAATSLGRLWAAQGKAKEAHALLSDVHGWFTEGLDTPDLVEAGALLDQLRPGHRGAA